MRNKIVYIAGPFRAANQWQQTLNIQEAEGIAAEVWLSGAMAVCPHLNSIHFTGLLPDRDVLEAYIHLLKRCDAVVTCPRWRYSPGATQEVRVAIQEGIPVFHHWICFKHWLRTGEIKSVRELTQERPQQATAQDEVLPGDPDNSPLLGEEQEDVRTGSV